MKQVFFKNGQVTVEEIPAPMVQKGTVLVRTNHSCISSGTELSSLKTNRISLYKKALKPENAKKVLTMVSARGFSYTRRLVQGRLNEGLSTGYSAAGIVLETGAGITDLKSGDRVACAGAQWAHHAEVICVPRNLTVSVPVDLDLKIASTVTLGAIALQGIRRAQPALGETFVVIGLGVIGQLTAQLLRLNGCRVMGVDLDQERTRLAQSLGLDFGLYGDDGNQLEQVACLTGGIGADGVIITADTTSSKVIATAFKMCRKKGRVILVGDVGLSLNRADFYQKELDLLISSSYGPGRYDPIYEEAGLDYPVAYVRWTENRNLAEYIRLLAAAKLKVEPLLSKVYSVEEAATAYQCLKNSRSLMILLSYPNSSNIPSIKRITVDPLPRPTVSKTQIKLALIGAGDFAKGVHLPSLQLLANRYHLRAIVSRSGHNALVTAEQYGAQYATTDYREVLQDPNIEAVLIATRHNLHARMVLESLQAGKHVMVEKPLALTEVELHEIKNFYSSAAEKVPLLLTGFNRRFSPYVKCIHAIIKDRTNPMILNYRINASCLPPDIWLYTDEGGGRNKGEACHIYDLFTYLTGSKVVSIDTRTAGIADGYYKRRDNFTVLITFEDGSMATLIFTTFGCRNYPKEQLEIFVDGKILVLNDYKSLIVKGAKVKDLHSKIPEKGQKEELEAFARAIKEGGEWPIPLWQQFQATEISFAVENSLNGN